MNDPRLNPDSYGPAEEPAEPQRQPFNIDPEMFNVDPPDPKTGLTMEASLDGLAPEEVHMFESIAGKTKHDMAESSIQMQAFKGRGPSQIRADLTAAKMARTALEMANEAVHLSEQEFDQLIKEMEEMDRNEPVEVAERDPLEMPSHLELGASALMSLTDPNNAFAYGAAPFNVSAQRREEKFQTKREMIEARKAQRQTQRQGLQTRLTLTDRKTARAREHLQKLTDAAAEEARLLRESGDKKNVRVGTLIGTITRADKPNEALLAWDELNTLDPERGARYKSLAEKVDTFVTQEWETKQADVKARTAARVQSTEQAKLLFPFEQKTAEENAKQEGLATLLAQNKVDMAPWQLKLLKRRHELAQLQVEWYPKLSQSTLNNSIANRQMAEFYAQMSITRFDDAASRFKYDQSADARREYFDSIQIASQNARFNVDSLEEEIKGLEDALLGARADEREKINALLKDARSSKTFWLGKVKTLTDPDGIMKGAPPAGTYSPPPTPGAPQSNLGTRPVIPPGPEGMPAGDIGQGEMSPIAFAHNEYQMALAALKAGKPKAEVIRMYEDRVKKRGAKDWRWPGAR